MVNARNRPDLTLDGKVDPGCLSNHPHAHLSCSNTLTLISWWGYSMNRFHNINFSGSPLQMQGWRFVPSIRSFFISNILCKSTLWAKRAQEQRMEISTPSTPGRIWSWNHLSCPLLITHARWVNRSFVRFSVSLVHDCQDSWILLRFFYCLFWNGIQLQ